MKRTFCLVALMAAGVACIAMGQDAAAQDVQNTQNPQPEETLVIVQGEQSGSSPSDRALANMRNAIGFSVGVFEIYAPNASSTFTLGDKHPMYTMVKPHVFANAKSGRSSFRFDISMGYQRYNRNSAVHTSDEEARMEFEHKTSRYTTLSISDTFRTMVNDSGVLPAVDTPTMYQPSFAQQLYLPGERTTTNSLTANFGYRIGRRTNLTFYGSYDLWRYRNSSFGKAQGVQAGIRFDRQLNKWFFLQTSYSHYLNSMDPRLEPASIQRLQAGGLKFKLSRDTEVYFSGGADYTRFQGKGIPAASYEAGFSRSGKSNKLSLVYHRGLSTSVGAEATTFNGHIATLSISQWLIQRVNFQLHSSYNRGVSPDRRVSPGVRPKLEYIAGSAEIDVILQRHLLFSTEYSYVSQGGRNLSAGVPLLNRYTVTAGVQYFLPSLGKRPRARINEQPSVR